MSSIEVNRFFGSADEIEYRLREIFRKSSSCPSNNSVVENDPLYRMDHDRRGTCIILNHLTFDDPSLPDRHGTNLDAHALNVSFSLLGFDVRVFNDLTRTEIMDTLESAGNEDYTDQDVLVCFFLTYGAGHSLWAKDSKYSIKSALGFFDSVSCPTLTWKPKLFLIQACQTKRGREPFCFPRDGWFPYTWNGYFISSSIVSIRYKKHNTSVFMQLFSQVILELGSSEELHEVLKELYKRLWDIFKPYCRKENDELYQLYVSGRIIDNLGGPISFPPKYSLSLKHCL